MHCADAMQNLCGICVLQPSSSQWEHPWLQQECLWLQKRCFGLPWGCLELKMGAPGAATGAPTAASGAPIAGNSDAYTMRMLCGTCAEYA